MGGGTYEQEFAAEMARAKEGKAKSTPWGSGYGRAPDILHGARETGCAMHATGCAMQRGVPWPCMVSLGGPAKSTPWGSGYGRAPEILHGVWATGVPCMVWVGGLAKPTALGGKRQH